MNAPSPTNHDPLRDPLEDTHVDINEELVAELLEVRDHVGSVAHENGGTKKGGSLRSRQLGSRIGGYALTMA